MSYFNELHCENSKTNKLIESQTTITPRSGKIVLPSSIQNCRPYSANPCQRNQTDNQADYIRPKSADYTTSNFSQAKPCQWPYGPIARNLNGDSSIRLSHFVDLSSKLLQNLLGNSRQRVPEVGSKSSSTECLARTATAYKPEAIKVEKCAEPENHKYFDSNSSSKLQESSITCLSKDVDSENFKAESRLPEVVEEKTVKFSDWYPLDFHPEKKCNHHKTLASHKNKRKYNSCLNNNFKSLFQEVCTCKKWQKAPETNFLALEGSKTDSEVKSRGDFIKSFYSDSEAETSKPVEKNKEEIMCFGDLENIAKECNSKKSEKKVDNLNDSLKSSCQSNLKIDSKHAENVFYKKLETTAQDFCEETQKGRKLHEDKEDLKHDQALKKSDVTDSTYEEIVHLLQTLQNEEDSESLNLEGKDEAVTISGLEAPSSEKIDYLNAVSSYLEEIEMECDEFDVNFRSTENWSSESIISPRLEELLNKSSIELAHEVFSLKIQIEDQKKGIKLLRDTLAEMKEAKKNVELEHQEALHKVTSEAEALVHRHQKFIKQLLNEKKNLNETVSKLVQDLKSGEEKYKKNIKAIEEKHLIEIKRAKEAQATADKIKREKWMENKTKKIKEMTVKGLEPELSRMAARQQEEMTELRNLHKAELEAVELRAARRNSELMDELRAELTKEKERAIAKETATLRAAMEKEFEEEKNKLQQYCQTLKERVRKQEERLSNQELEFQQRLIDYKQEEERNKQKIMRKNQETLEEIRRQHLVELKSLKETEEADKQALLNNYKKEQAAKFLEREAELHQEYKKERDKEIEMVIEALEKESAQIQSELNNANEGRLKRLKDKMEAEIKELEASEAALKVKLSEAKSKLSEKEDLMTELHSEIRQLQTELTFFKKSCEEMSLEKSKLKEIIRGEFENSISGLLKEKENFEKEITALKELHTKELAKKDQLNLQIKYEMQKELTRVYSRIKTAVNKKEKIIESLREENGAANQKCRQLEFLLDQQRRNLLLHESSWGIAPRLKTLLSSRGLKRNKCRSNWGFLDFYGIMTVNNSDGNVKEEKQQGIRDYENKN